MPDAIVSTHIRKRGVICSPSHSAAFMLPISAPDDLSIPQTHSITLLQCLDELTPSFEVASRQHFKTTQEQSSSPESIAMRESSIPRILFSPSTCAKAQGQFVEAILDRQPHKGTSLTNRIPANGVMPVSASSNHSEGRLSVKGSTDEVNIGSGEGLSATKCSPLPDAALTPHKPTPILSLQALTAPPAKDMAPQSSRKFLAQHSPNAVSTHRVGSHVTHHKIEAHQGVSDSSSLPQLTWSFPMDSEWLRKACTVSSRHERNVKTHREAEVLTRASSRAVSPQLDKTPPAGVLEHFEKCSVIAAKPATEQALIPSSTEVGERQWVPTDAIVSIHNGEEENKCSPHPLAVITLPASAPTSPSTLPMSTVPYLQPPIEPVLPIEVMPR